MFSIAAVARSFAGGRDYNEDCTAIEHRDDGHCCLVLSDGAGGHAGGAVASRIAVNKVLEGFRARPPVDADDLAELLLDAHDAVQAAQRAAEGPAQSMHATIVVLTLDANAGTALWGHVGDSRLYVLRQGAVVAVTRDDSVVQWMVDSGYLPAEQARTHPKKNRLLAALGADTDLQPTVQVEPYRLEIGDAFLLCTDGWWDSLAGGQIESELSLAPSVDAWLDAMAETIAQNTDPDHDNYSAIGCWIERPRKPAAGGEFHKTGFDWESS
ncbi:MAG TPA: protein phosphatase 2C domain-containing protein [Burkholderiaceae bacterium]|nr:protein phosphatase 2C domain-containing protein [Burkholderiaceae bacterium]